MDPKKKKAKATPVSRDELRATFVTLDQTSCDTPLRDNMKALATQNFATASILHHQEFGIATTPSTQLLHYAVTMIRDAGTDSVVDRKTTILDVARQYLKKIHRPEVLKWLEAKYYSRRRRGTLLPNHHSCGLVT
jgi:hypothetical protein